MEEALEAPYEGFGPSTETGPAAGRPARPRSLLVFCVLGLMGAPTLVVGGLFVASHDPAGLLDVLFGLLGAAIFWGLLKGSHKAWVAIHWLWTAGIVCNVFLILAALTSGDRAAQTVLVLHLVVRVVMVSVLYVFFHTSGVMRYCSAAPA